MGVVQLDGVVVGKLRPGLQIHPSQCEDSVESDALDSQLRAS